MKNALFALAGLALLAGAPLTARALPAPTLVSADPLDSRLDAAWSDLNSKWMLGTITDREFQLVTDLLIKITDNAKATYPDAPTLRYRLQAALDDLRTRATSAVRQAAYADAVWEQLVDFRVNRTLAYIKERAAAGKSTDADWQEFMETLEKRAGAAKDDAATTATVLAAVKAQAELIKARALKGALAAQDFKELELNLAENRLYRSSLRLRTLLADESRRTATHFDYVRVKDSVGDRNKSDNITSDVTTAYLAAIDSLEAAYGNDRMSKDMFDKLMEQLKVRYLAATKS